MSHPSTSPLYTLSLHDALPIYLRPRYPERRIKLERKDGDLSMRVMDILSPIGMGQRGLIVSPPKAGKTILLQKLANSDGRSEEHTSELQSLTNLVCRLLLEKKK